MNAIINIGLLLAAIQKKGWSGFQQAAAHCHVSVETLNKISQGQIPRLDALFRICSGLDIRLEDLIRGAHQTEKKPGRHVLPGRWSSKQVARDEG
jgi:transcriptional regulator with XRE-family HTH domain